MSFHNPVWERFLDKLLDEYDSDEDAVFEENDIPSLQNLVRQREIFLLLWKHLVNVEGFEPSAT